MSLLHMTSRALAQKEANFLQLQRLMIFSLEYKENLLADELCYDTEGEKRAQALSIFSL